MSSSSGPGNNSRGGKQNESSELKNSQKDKSSKATEESKRKQGAQPAPRVAVESRASIDDSPNSPPPQPEPGNLAPNYIVPDGVSVGNPALSVRSNACSDAASNNGITGNILREYAAFTLSLVRTGDQWDLESLVAPLDLRKKHKPFFQQFCKATQYRAWNMSFDEETSKAEIPPELYDELKRDVTGDSTLATEVLESTLGDFMKTKMGAIVTAIKEARELKAQLRDKFMSPQLEQEFRLVFDRFFHHFLDDNQERVTIIERTLNFPRNRHAELLKTSRHAEAAKKHLQRLTALHGEHVDYLGEAFTWSSNHPLQKTDPIFLDVKENKDKHWISHNVQYSEDIRRLNLFRKVSPFALQEQKDVDKLWSAIKADYETRVKLLPRDGKCDAITFYRAEAPSKFIAELKGSTRDDLRKKLLQKCAFIQLTQDEMSDSTSQAEGTDWGSSLYCQDLGRRTNLNSTHDALGSAAVVSELERRKGGQSTSSSGVSTGLVKQPEDEADINSRSSLIRKDTIREGLQLDTTTPILVPLLIHEYKRPLSEFHGTATNQAMMYLNAACHYLYYMGVHKFMVYGIVAEGTNVTVMAAWKEGPKGVSSDDSEVTPTFIINHNTVKYDLSQPKDAYQFACFVAWVHVTHRKDMEHRLSESTIESFVKRVHEGKVNWTVSHQNPRKGPSNTGAASNPGAASK